MHSVGQKRALCENIPVGEKIALAGRIQSRIYQKRISDTEVKEMTAYEVSVSRLSAYENADNFDLDEELFLCGDKLLKEIV